jgi:hypothetical protein
MPARGVCEKVSELADCRRDFPANGFFILGSRFERDRREDESDSTIGSSTGSGFI